jgi:ribulose-5-phosphate 4-epimerase/fuculose-1-phosphate aldolase
MDENEQKLRETLVEIARYCESHDLLVFTQGNFSARIPGTERVLITPSDVEYPTMTPDDIVEIDLNGNKIDGIYEPSSEASIHTTAMKRHPAVMAGAHIEPPYLNALYAVNKEVPNILGNFVYLFGGRGIAVGPSIRSANQEFADKTLDAMGDKFGVVWKNHGLFCVGPDPRTAFKRCMAAEQASRVYYLALSLNQGEPDLIPQEVQDEMVEAARQHGWIQAI